MTNQDLSTLKKLAEEGNVDAMYELGIRHIEMRGVPAGTKTAQDGIMWLEAAADRGHTEAAFRLGEEYYFSRVPGMKNDDAKRNKAAADWYEVAQKSGDPKAGKSIIKAMQSYEIYSSGKTWEPSRPLHLSDTMTPPWAAVTPKPTTTGSKPSQRPQNNTETKKNPEEQRRAEEQKRREEAKAKQFAARLADYRAKRFAEEEAKVNGRRAKTITIKLLGIPVLVITFLSCGWLWENCADAVIMWCMIPLFLFGGSMMLLLYKPKYDPHLHPDIREQKCKNCAYCVDHYVNTITTTYEDGVEKSSNVTDVRHDHYECQHPSVKAVVQDGSSCKNFVHFIDAEFSQKYQKEQEQEKKRAAEAERLRKAGFRK